MSIRLPGHNLYYLPEDKLAPKEYERILYPSLAWSRICEKYEFYDGQNADFQLINMRERSYYRNLYQLGSHGHGEKARLKRMVFSGDVVMLSDMHSLGNLFYINDEGKLICSNSYAFYFSGANKIICAYDRAVNRKDYQRTGGKPRPTVRQIRGKGVQSESYGAINSKAAGRLLAAGGIYNQNPQMFADTARKLGGEAAVGFDQVLNEQTAGSLVALSSLAMLGRASAAGRQSMASMEELQHFLGKSKGDHKLLNNIDAVKMEYFRRDRAEVTALRRSFDAKIRSNFARSISSHPDVINRLTKDEIKVLAKGNIPEGFNVHHKLPLDDSGTNAFSNLILIRSQHEHNVFTNAQRGIMKNVPVNSSKEVLWPVPRGVIYP